VKNTPSSPAPSSHASAKRFPCSWKVCMNWSSLFPLMDHPAQPFFPHGSTSSSLVRDVTYLLMITMGWRHGRNPRHSSWQGIWGWEEGEGEGRMRWRGLVMTSEGGSERGGGAASANAVSLLATYASLVHSTA